VIRGRIVSSVPRLSVTKAPRMNGPQAGWAPRSTHIPTQVTLFVTFALVLSLNWTTGLSAQDLFPDKALEAAVRWEVFEKRFNTDPIKADDVKNISQVVAKGKGIKSLEGLQHCKAIMKIDLANNEIVDLAPITELKLLQSIDLSSNKITSIAPMAGLLQSQYVQLSKNAIEDISPLKDMKNMNSLYITDNKIKSLEPVAGLKKLWTLQVAGNPVENVAAIGELKGLKTLNMKNCGLKKLDFVKELKELSLLMLDQNPLESLEPLAESCEADTGRRFAPFLRLYLDPKLVGDQSSTIERLRKVGVRVNPEKK